MSSAPRPGVTAESMEKKLTPPSSCSMVRATDSASALSLVWRAILIFTCEGTPLSSAAPVAASGSCSTSPEALMTVSGQR